MAKNGETVKQIEFSEEMKNSYRDYAMSVIIDRALPDVRDGLKPVQRRILYAMQQLGLNPNSPHRKSARIVGDTMGKYHPHGDSSIYEALVHMSQDFVMQIPFVDGHGNFGSIDGDSAAAMRYTEARLSIGAKSSLEHLDDGLVDFIPNFDESEKEPVVLPATLPNLLINGTTGIAVGMSTNMPPHNPSEVLDACAAFLDNPYMSLDELMQYIPGPDFPTGGIIINPEEIENIYQTGEGKLRLRAKAHIESGEYGKNNIIVTEIPYTMSGNKQKLFEEIVDLMQNKVFDEISDVRDESSKEGIRIVIEVKKDRDASNLLNGLFKKTDLEATFGVTMLAVKDKQPVTFSLYSLISEFVAFQEEIYTKEYQHLLNKANNRLEIVDGLLKAADVIDVIVEMLRGCENKAQAKDCLVNGNIANISFKTPAFTKIAEKFCFTENQADAILAMQLVRLIGLEINMLMNEKDTLLKNIDEFNKILGSKRELHKVIKKKLLEYRKLFDMPRKTTIEAMSSVDYKVEVKEEDLFVMIDRFGYAKTLDEQSFVKGFGDEVSAYVEEMKKNLPGFDLKAAEKVAKNPDGSESREPGEEQDAGESKLKPSDYPQRMILGDNVTVLKLSNTDDLCFFTAEGNMFRIKLDKIPKGKPKDKGTLLHNLSKLGDETPIFYIGFNEMFDNSLLFITKKGFIRRVSGVDFDASRQMIAAAKLDKDDEVVQISIITPMQAIAGDDKVIIITKTGISLKFLLEEVPEMKKTGRGVKAITLNEKDYVEFLTVVNDFQQTFKYNNKTCSVSKINLQKRAGKGRKASIYI